MGKLDETVDQRLKQVGLRVDVRVGLLVGLLGLFISFFMVVLQASFNVFVETVDEEAKVSVRGRSETSDGPRRGA